MANILILHGWGGSDFPHWQSWLASEIAKGYGTVSFPLLANPDFPNKEIWKAQAMQYLNDFHPDIVICHSLANILWFHLCHEGLISPVKRLLLVAPPHLTCEIETLKTFFPLEAPTNLFADEVLLVTSTNDPYMSTDEAMTLKEALDVEMKVIENGGHINTSSGFGEWPWVKEWVLQ